MSLMAYTASAAAARALVARSTLRPVASQISAAKMDMASTPGRTRNAVVCLDVVVISLGVGRSVRRLFFAVIEVTCRACEHRPLLSFEWKL